MRVLFCCASEENASAVVSELRELGYEAHVFDRWDRMLSEARTNPCDLMVLELLTVLGPGRSLQAYEHFAIEKMEDPRLYPIPLVLVGLPPEEETDQMIGWPGFLYAYLRYPVEPEALLRVLRHVREGAPRSA